MAETPTTHRETVLVMDEAARARQVAEEFAELQKPGNRPDEAKKPGGVFVGTDGEEHDAHGNNLGGQRPAALAAADKLSSDEVDVRLKEIEAERAALLARRAPAQFEDQQKASVAAKKTADVKGKGR